MALIKLIMATLQHHTLIYDRDCPMCRLYTGAFVHQGWLDEQGRQPYSEIAEGEYSSLDMQRAKDEIALVNRETGAVTYGLQGLIAVITFRWPVFKGLLANKLVCGALQQLYFFISYNRKVIAAVKPTGRPCNPSYHFGYRLAYLIVSFFAVSAVLTAYAHLMQGLLPQGIAAREYGVCGGQILFQGAVLCVYKRSRLMDYLGNMMTVSLMGAIALLPVLILSHWLKVAPLFAVACFLMIAGGMLLEHLRRMKLLGLGWLPSITWVLYRCLVLLIILL